MMWRKPLFPQICADLANPYTGESASHCEECGKPIPEARRKAIPCQYCLPCQTAQEKKGA